MPSVLNTDAIPSLPKHNWCTKRNDCNKRTENDKEWSQYAGIRFCGFLHGLLKEPIISLIKLNMANGRHIENSSWPLFCFPTAFWDSTSGGFCIVSDTIVIGYLSASGLPLRTIKFCSVLFGLMSSAKVTSSLAVTNKVHWCVAIVVSVCRDTRNCWWHFTSLRCQSQILVENRSYPTCIQCPRQEGPRQNIAITFGTEKLEWCGYPTVKKLWEHVYLFRHNTRTWRTDEQTDNVRRHRPHLCIA